MWSIEHLGPGVTVFAAASSREAEVRATKAARKLPPIPTVRIPGAEKLVMRLVKGMAVNPVTGTSAEEAHAYELADASYDQHKAEELGALFARHTTWQCPDAGVPMVAGTDACGAAGIIPGFSLHDEFDHLAEAGLGPLTILRMTTTEPARFLGEEGAFGRIAAGLPADLVLLDEDPLRHHTALRKIAGVLRDGSWWSRAELDAVLDRIAAKPGAH
ncbi:amidohydrolase family protein [Streptomyces sp. NPDC051546]|uniref:amidohydrolase family protein n=1 Tax=Streptomyces sp. NPDC051546 TaxID=3365655 RepID=UPI00378871A5